MAGFDATLSAPKSLSVWWALTGDEGLAECHDVAVRGGRRRSSGSVRRPVIRSNGSRLHPDTGGLTVAAFRQTTSRLDDPQLHTHVVISSKVQTDDGRWLALDARVLKQHQRAFGGLYQSVLRAELHQPVRRRVRRDRQRSGRDRRRARRVAGAVLQARRPGRRGVRPKLAEFSTREGRDPTPFERARSDGKPPLDTRDHKTGHGVPDLRDTVAPKPPTVGVTPIDLTDVDRCCRQVAGAAGGDGQRGDRRCRRNGRRGTGWTSSGACATAPAPATRIAAAVGGSWSIGLSTGSSTSASTSTRSRDVACAGRMVVRCGSNRSPRTSPAQLVLAQEEQILSWAIDTQLDDPQPSTTVERGRLDVLQSRRRRGGRRPRPARRSSSVRPGRARPRMLAAAVDDLDRHRRPVIGLAPTAKAARVFERDTGMVADTVAKLLHDWRPTRRPTRIDWDCAAAPR